MEVGGGGGLSCSSGRGANLDRSGAQEVAWRLPEVFDFVGFVGDVVTKARVFDQCMKKPEAVSAPKILRMLVNFSGRVENLLKELRLLLQHDGRGQEARPSERCLEPGPEAARLELASPPASTPGAPATRGPSASTPRSEATQHQPKPAATSAIPDPTHQEPIPDSLNTNDIPSLHQWATEGLWDSATPATGSRGPTDPVVQITSGSITRSQRRRTGSVQANLFGVAQEELVEGFRRWVRDQIAQRAELAEEARSVSKAEEDPVGGEDKEDEEVKEEEEEDPGSSDAYDSGEEEDDDNLPPASSHRPVTRSTSKKPISWPKRKAYRTKGSGPGSSSRKRSRGSQE